MNRMILLAGLLIPGLVSAQSSSTGGAPDRFEIEVATVKQNKAGGGQSIQLSPAGRLNVTNMPVRQLIRIAYATDAIQVPGQIVGGASWIDAERFDIAAKATVEPQLKTDTFQVMVRSVLEDRFHVKVHTEMRESPMYALVLANKDGRLGSSLKRSDGKCYSRNNPPPPNAPFDPSTFCSIRGGAGDMTYTGQTIQAIGRNLANYPVIGRPVIDRTGLQGTYDLHIVFVPAFIDSPNGPPVANPAADSGPNLFTALVEQAGLKLQGERGAVEFLVIDGVERPTED